MVVRGNSTVPRCSGEGSGARVTPALARSSHSSIPETLARFVGVHSDKVLDSVVVGAATPVLESMPPSVHEVLRDARFV